MQETTSRFVSSYGSGFVLGRGSKNVLHGNGFQVDSSSPTMTRRRRRDRVFCRVKSRKKGLGLGKEKVGKEKVAGTNAIKLSCFFWSEEGLPQFFSGFRKQFVRFSPAFLHPRFHPTRTLRVDDQTRQFLPGFGMT